MMHSMNNKIWPQVIRPIGELNGKDYKVSVFDDGSLEYWFELSDVDEEEIPTIPDARFVA